MMNAKQKQNFLLTVAFWAVIALLFVWGIKIAFRLFWPFFAGLFLAFFLHPAVNWISRFSCAKKSFWSVTILLLLYAVLGAVLCLLCGWAIAGVEKLLQILPQIYEEQIRPFLALLEQQFSAPKTRGSSPLQLMDGILPKIQETLVEFTGKALSAASSWAAKAPAVFTAFLFAVLSSFMISLEYQNITLWIRHNTPRRIHLILADLKDFLFSTLFQMGKAYFLLFGITFAEIALGLWLIGIEHVWYWALIVAVADALPVVGPGIILVPWAVVSLVYANYWEGIGLLALFGIVALVRTIIEPRILGKQFGLHPLATITAMYAGAQLFGIWGFFFAPVAVLYFMHLKARQNWSFSLKNLF